MTFRAAIALAGLIALAACSGSDEPADPTAITANEAQALDEAAEMIEQRRLPEGTVPAEAGAQDAAAAAEPAE
ncbi:hypothetical protein [Qipengyuania marisflavi]|uniref:Uncharacterized protein n=1 Tax=Qipengyuania marisflavi TaxID=2486356 RepID=A0A5S3PXP4_9SPHN|nr:hypothetical protein [Qipengyuania marisflavi]TMM48365.1 hypothetical protein FEV51_08795 [Qipengyuania marisflavi]